MSWQPIELYYNHSLAGLTATSAVSGYPVSNILQRIDGNLWKATSAATQYITFDAGSGKTITPDFLLLYGHNLGTAGAEIVLQYSSDNFSADNHDAFTEFSAADDDTILKTFTWVEARYWRLKISGASVAPFITMGYWGVTTELDFADGLTPHNLDRKANVNVSENGYVQGIHEKYTEWELRIDFASADSTLLGKLQAWEAAVGLGLFGISWDPGDHSTDVRVMRRKGGSFSAPLGNGGAYVDISIDLVGRVA